MFIHNPLKRERVSRLRAAQGAKKADKTGQNRTPGAAPLWVARPCRKKGSTPWHAGRPSANMNPSVFRDRRPRAPAGSQRPSFSTWSCDRTTVRGPTGTQRIMVNRNLLRQLDLPDDVMEHELEAAFRREDIGGTVDNWLEDQKQEFEVNKIVNGRVAQHRRRRCRGRRRLQERRRHPARGVVRRGRRQGRAAPARRRDPGPARRRRGRDRRHRPQLPQGQAAEGMGRRHRQAQGRRRRRRPGHPQDQGRPAGQHRRQRLPARQPGRHPPAAATSATTSARPSSARSSRSTRPAATSSSAAAS